VGGGGGLGVQAAHESAPEWLQQDHRRGGGGTGLGVQAAHDAQPVWLLPDHTDAAVVAVASGCKQLTTLVLRGCSKITDAAVVAVTSGCKQLTTLVLIGCCQITNAAKANTPNRIRVA
jgi:hypothetical protein